MSQYILTLFSKGGCPPCIETQLSLQQVTLPARMALEKRKLELDGEEVFRKSGVQSTPTLILYRQNDGGQISEQRRLVGAQSVEAIEAFVQIEGAAY
ncbi:thioredoxin family protein [Listeria booriae]|uniref:Thioredoxin family protein n=1 Tax=Listeria booriae TaxID=1552123 RepID=A0A842AC20_9LIST|nr:thioredoxin family protein [Listeria booriae]MBC1615373.1 thioredoxin family protein [Listeria booriae]